MHRRVFVLISLLGIVAAAWSLHAEEPSGLFPLGKEWAGDKELPRPLGIDLTFYHQNQDYDLANLSVNVPGVSLAQASGIVVGNRTDELHVKADLWLLPFLNVFAIVGDVEGKTTVDPGPPLSELEVDYDGLVYGGGLTIAAGGKWFFGSVTGTFTGTELDTSTSSVEAWIITPRVGVRLNSTVFWVGGMYQQAEERHSGRLSLPFYGDVVYDVELEEQEPWNYVAGFRTGLGERWELEFEEGFGDRKHFLVSLGYRF